MRAAWVVIGVVLVLTSGCAQKDWIDRTLVTVDVTGSWYGIIGGVQTPGISLDLRFELAQQGPTVRGSLQARSGIGDLSGPIKGTVGGDVFRFRNTRGGMEGELTVSGDEMTGQISTSFGNRPLFLRRVDASSPPGSPPR